MLKSLILLTVLVCTKLCHAQTPATTGQKTQDAFLITRMMEKFHIAPRSLDDSLSSALYAGMLNALDEDRIFFTAQDIRKLSVFQFSLDEEIWNRQDKYLQLITGIYKQRLLQADTMIDHICAKPFDLHRSETFTHAEDTTNPADLAAMHVKLYKILKLNVVNAIADWYMDHSQKPSAFITDSLERSQRKKKGALFARSIKRILQSPIGIEQTIGTIYCQVLASCYDPHTAYLTMDEKDDFESQLGNKPLSYGLSLTNDDDGNPRIGKLTPGGPAFQSGNLHEGDKILSVQWDDKDPIDVSGAGLQEVASILSTEGGDKLTLSVRKADGTIRQASLRKERLSSDDEDKVKGFILKGARTIGYISLPAFYSDWENSKGVNGCANDVARQIIKMKKENIEGLILDLRYNGGGSVSEAVDLAGIFIDAGPLAQIKEKDAKVITLKDVTRGTIYDGPLLLLVNGSSASASEILAGSLQDYNRAVIAGSPTYGKATAQIILPMDTTIDLENFDQKKQAGSYIKVTVSKLYRINGTSAQAKGVIPDILLPEPSDDQEERESNEKFALPSGAIDANKYYRPLPPLPVAGLQDKARAAMQADSFFIRVRSLSESKTTSTGTAIPMSLEDLLAKKQANAKNRPGAPGTAPKEKNDLFKVTNNAYEQQRLQTDSSLKEENEESRSNVLLDPYIKIAYQVVSVMSK